MILFSAANRSLAEELVCSISGNVEMQTQSWVKGWLEVRVGAELVSWSGCLRPSQIPVCKDLNTSAGTLTPFLVSAKVGRPGHRICPGQVHGQVLRRLSFPGVTGPHGRPTVRSPTFLA